MYVLQVVIVICNKNKYTYTRTHVHDLRVHLYRRTPGTTGNLSRVKICFYFSIMNLWGTPGYTSTQP